MKCSLPTCLSNLIALFCLMQLLSRVSLLVVVPSNPVVAVGVIWRRRACVVETVKSYEADTLCSLFLNLLWALLGLWNWFLPLLNSGDWDKPLARISWDGFLRVGSVMKRPKASDKVLDAMVFTSSADTISWAATGYDWTIWRKSSYWDGEAHAECSIPVYISIYNLSWSTIVGSLL